jgi:hypothetical protein
VDLHTSKTRNQREITRKGMLNILSVYVGKSGWDELKFVDTIDSKKDITRSFSKENLKKKFGLLLLIFVVFAFGIYFISKKYDKKPSIIKFQNSYTKDSISNEDVKAFVVEDSVEKPIDLKSESLHLEKGTKVVIKSPFYKQKEITISPNEPLSRVELNPNDYAMMLKAFMKSDIKDWQTRKEQLNKILSDNLEVMIMLQNDLGAEYFNKTEFSQKVVIPSASLKKLKIVELKQEKDNKISFLRLTEE